ncbi:MAG: hypothetical protein KIT09_28325 [Bryobacteraceae bacterium]|nr:hypothetical protein [Bryobacteraceae bacterium]
MLLCLHLPGQTASELGLSPEALLIARIRVKAEENLTRLPNYTCTQSVERSTRRAPARRYRLMDTLRLEVALVDGKEFFAWPGSERFEEHELRKIVPRGAIGNGAFALHARSVFLSGWPRFHHVARERIDGRLCERFNYDVALPGSGYRIRVNEQEAVVPYHGSFWVDAETLNLVRLEVVADDIPFHLRLESAEQQIDYEPVEIGASSFVLPRRAVSVLVDLEGNESRNETRFSGCRQYAGESYLSFDEAPEREAEAAQAPAAFELPGGLYIILALDEPIDARAAATGDPVTAVLQSNVKRKGTLIAPKGAIVKGRLAAVENLVDDYWRIAIRLEWLEFDNRRAPLRARLEEVSPIMLGGARLSTTLGAQGAVFRRMREPEQPFGAGAIYVKGGMICLPRGTRMTWRTLDAAVDEKPQ